MPLPNNIQENNNIFSLSIPIRIEYDECLKKIHPTRRPPDENLLKTIVHKSNELVQPQSVFRLACIESVEHDGVVIDKTRFSGPLLPQTLPKTSAVFPFIITLGQKLDDKIFSSDNLMEQFYFDQIGNILLKKCGTYLESHIKKSYAVKQLSSISPGSLTTWPIEEQKPLFSLFGNTQSLIGVSLTPQMLMIPSKSISGFFFPTQEKFIACSFCSRKKCPERSAPYKY